MGSQCSNLYNQMTSNTNPRDQFITSQSKNFTPIE